MCNLILFSLSYTMESNQMDIDESIDNSNDSSVVLNASPSTKLFPIFTNKNPSSGLMIQ